MVGVHGGSKGCFRCRKRKVKCDEARPTCKRCEKGGYECGGYRDLFQFDDRSTSKTAARSLAIVSQGQQPSLTSIAVPPPPLTDATWSPPAESEGEWESTLDFGLTIPNFLGLEPFSEDFCVSYTNTHLMKGSGDAQQNWAIPGIASFSKNALVRDCILALSLSYFGQHYHDKVTLSRGACLYGSTLGRLNKALGDSSQNRSVPTLESIMVLTLYEVLMGTNMKSFVAHVLGLEVLLKMLGPESVSQSRAALELLESSRPVICSACTLTLKETVLAAPEWKTIPWSTNLKVKSDLQLLYDVMVDIPGLTVNVWDPVSPGFRPRHVQGQDLDVLYMRARRILSDYEAWRANWEQRHSNHMLEFIPLWTPQGWFGSYADLPWSKIWHFSAIVVAQAYITYQAGKIITLRLVHNLEQSGLLKVDHPTISRETELQHAAVEICRSVEWMLSDERSGAGGLYLLMPSRCAWKTLPICSPQQQWMLAATRQIAKGSRGGWSMADPMSKQLTLHHKNGKARIDVPEAEP